MVDKRSWKAWPARLDKWLRVSVRRALLEEDLAQLDVDYGAAALEIGAGRQGRRGEYTPPVEKVKTWVQFDINRHSRPHAQGDLQRLPFAGQRFDSALCLEVLEYLDEPLLGLQELRRVLRPGATLVLSAPFFHRWDTEHDYWRFTEPGLQRLLAAAGFEDVEIKPQGAAFAAVVNTLKFAVHNLERRRMFWGLLLRPFLNALWKRDARWAQRLPILATFSTGYLLVARTPS